MKRRSQGISVLLAFAALVALVSPSVAATDKPNIVLIIADDLGWSSPRKADGNPIFAPQSLDDPAAFYETPKLAELADNGIVFKSFYVLQTCSPTRASLITGQLTARHKLYHQSGIQSWVAPPAHELNENPEYVADDRFDDDAILTSAEESYLDIVDIDKDGNNNLHLRPSIFRSLRTNGYNVGWFGKNHGTGDAYCDDECGCRARSR